MCNMYRDKASGFVKYFEKNYMHCWRKWLRCAIINQHDKPWLIPTTSGSGESYHFVLKLKDLKTKYVRLFIDALLRPHSH